MNNQHGWPASVDKTTYIFNKPCTCLFDFFFSKSNHQLKYIIHCHSQGGSNKGQGQLPQNFFFTNILIITFIFIKILKNIFILLLYERKFYFLPLPESKSGSASEHSSVWLHTVTLIRYILQCAVIRNS
jgi:hypothetical protein